MKKLLLFTLLLPVLCFGRNDFAIYREGQKADLYNEDTLPDKVHSELKPVELYVLGGYNLNSEPITGTFKNYDNNIWYSRGSGMRYGGGISLYLSQDLSLGVEYAGVNFTTKQYDELIRLATPAHEFLLNFSGHFLWSESGIDFSVLPGYSFIKNGRLHRGHYSDHDKNVTGSGVCLGARIQYRRYFTKHVYGLISTEFMYNNYNAEVWDYYVTSHFGSGFELRRQELNIKSFSFNVGLGYRF